MVILEIVIGKEASIDICSGSIKHKYVGRNEKLYDYLPTKKEMKKTIESKYKGLKSQKFCSN